MEGFLMKLSKGLMVRWCLQIRIAKKVTRYGWKVQAEGKAGHLLVERTKLNFAFLIWYMLLLM